MKRKIIDIYPSSEKRQRYLLKRRAAYKPTGNPPGRPLECTERTIELVRDLRYLGLSNAEICTVLRIHHDTLRRWLASIPELYEAYHMAGPAADGQVARALFQRATGYRHPDMKIMNVDGQVRRVPYIKHYAPDTHAAIAWLTNRHGAYWKSRQLLSGETANGDMVIPPVIIVRGIRVDEAKAIEGTAEPGDDKL